MQVKYDEFSFLSTCKGSLLLVRKRGKEHGAFASTATRFYHTSTVFSTVLLSQKKKKEFSLGFGARVWSKAFTNSDF